MNSKTIFLFIILILSLIIPCFLGSCYYEGFTSSSSPMMFSYTMTDYKGDIIEMDASVTQTPNGIDIIMYGPEHKTQSPVINLTNSTDSKTYNGPNGTTATITTDSDGLHILTISDPTSSTNNYVLKEKPTHTNTNTNNTSILNGNFDNYNHFTGSSYPSVFYGPPGYDINAKVIQNGNETSIIFTGSEGQQMILSSNNSSQPNTFYGLGNKAIINRKNNGKYEIELVSTDENNAGYGSSVKFTEDNHTLTPIHNNNNGYNVNSYTHINDTHANANPTTSTNTIKGSSLVLNNNNISNDINGNYNGNYNSSLPRGIPASQIPPGQEDLYILKSQVVPPVCPACPEPIVQCPTNFDLEQCPPCPACARCPEPSFECKKVPNYNAFNPDQMPVPVLNNFASFGM